MEDRRTYEEIVGYLGRVSPALEDAGALTQDIMAQIERIAPHKQKCRLLRLAGRLSGAAACLLMCLLMYDAAQLSPFRRQEASTATAAPAQRSQLDAPRAEQRYAAGSTKPTREKIAEAIKEKLGERCKREQRYAAYLRYSVRLQNN
ncbi:MAG: hypothetical protein LBT94_01685 [Prevotellaceae bacterium]|jgi:hypothetical protein|nr:hypothetical protein [Prevotellaceae bacterium]